MADGRPLTGGGGSQNFASSWQDDALRGPGVLASVELMRVGLCDSVGFGLQFDGRAAFNSAATLQTFDNVIAPCVRFSTAVAIL